MITQAQYFKDLTAKANAELARGESLNLNYTAEVSQFIRLNGSDGAKIRQIGSVSNADLDVSLFWASDSSIRKTTATVSLTGLLYEDWDRLKTMLELLRKEVADLPADPYAQLPINHGSSESTQTGKLLDPELAPEILVRPLEGLDISGIYAAGTSIRAMANSAGQFHWFNTEHFSFDYSLFTPAQRAVKGIYAGQNWDDGQYQQKIQASLALLANLEKPARKIAPGKYRTYLAPGSVADLVGMFSWACLSEAAIRQATSPLGKVRSGEKRFSEKFQLIEDFRGGECPRFNDEGELAPDMLPLIAQGGLAQTLVSSRSEKEYGVKSNGANAWETLRAPSLLPGSLEEDQILRELGTGLYLSNLHYLNWSDQIGGRVTGMTRYACFWVENGQIVSPIENLRWDDSIFELFGEHLVALTKDRAYQPDVGSYEWRSVGGSWVPGALLSEMSFTL